MFSHLAGLKVPTGEKLSRVARVAFPGVSLDWPLLCAIFSATVLYVANQRYMLDKYIYRLVPSQADTRAWMRIPTAVEVHTVSVD